MWRRRCASATLVLTALQIVRDPLHLVRGLHAFRVCLIRALRSENLHHGFDDRDVGLLQHAEFDGRLAVTAARGDSRLTGCARCEKKRTAGSLQRFRRAELGDANPPANAFASMDDRAYGAVLADGKIARVVGNVDAAQAPALRVAHAAVGRPREFTGARIGAFGAVLDDEEAFT